MSDINHNPTYQSIIKALAYYDIFQYPLTSPEIFKNLGTNHTSHKEVETALLQLASENYIFKSDRFYSIQHNDKLIERRVQGNLLAEKMLPLAKRKADFIYSFPFVRAVMASGSLSKNYMDEKSDLDFFIITSPNRLWIARMLLVVYKRLFLFNSHKHFCPNYFLDYDHLEIEEKNIFTATELSTLIPLTDTVYYDLLFEKNSWIENYFPNAERKISTPASGNYLLKNILESLINFFGGSVVNAFFMWLTKRRWQRIYRKQYSSSDFEIAFKTKNYASKNHPNHYQKKIVTLYNEKLASFAKQFNIEWLP